ncbi:2-C-methyl-D-erythritol 4-phosphate cytidylyltransferase [Metallibacterium scheffleri]|uniref:2-C-methyl-D-erythritol 4-phosphate cytidylyltransferase n=1 Tax=Metallibacterium scheffleri TaxID=993689 RepID=UPI0026EBA80D|nr:2-C-methyl-D-erythritol 4-phosphate cytidylyltransferase [Metallibacterium scheffleri]
MPGRESTRCWCVIPAAGRGARMGAAVPKQYLELGGRPLLLHTLQRLAAHARIAGLLVVLAADDARWPGITQLAGKPVLRARGGAERADSVLAGLRALPDTVVAQDCVLVHDAARPLLRAEDLECLVQAGLTHAHGAILAAPVHDTLKRADAAGCIAATEPRAGLWRALTPQMARRGDLERALVSAAEAGVAITDEAMALERIGLYPRMVEGSDDNLKITTPADLAYAEFWLAHND